MNTKMPKNTKKQTATPLGKNNELQILNKQHIKNEGINITKCLESRQLAV